uniref:Uncharacterized protein n=1 Tax=Arion vulgaris TaxID=1028688 RepID=A0A0B7B2G0_9EUPU
MFWWIRLAISDQELTGMEEIQIYMRDDGDELDRPKDEKRKAAEINNNVNTTQTAGKRGGLGAQGEELLRQSSKTCIGLRLR